MNQFDLIGDMYCIPPRIGMSTNVSLTCCCKIWKSLKKTSSWNILCPFRSSLPILLFPESPADTKYSVLPWIYLKMRHSYEEYWLSSRSQFKCDPGFNMPQSCSFACHVKWLHVKLWHSVYFFSNTHVHSLTIYCSLFQIYRMFFLSVRPLKNADTFLMGFFV